MHHSVTGICTCVQISVTKRCIVTYVTGVLWDVCNRSTQTIRISHPCQASRVDPKLPGHLVGTLPKYNEDQGCPLSCWASTFFIAFYLFAVMCCTLNETGCLNGSKMRLQFYLLRWCVFSWIWHDVDHSTSMFVGQGVHKLLNLFVIWLWHD